MSYKKEEDQKLYYYKNREKRIKYQREYDRKNKEKKNIYENKRRKLKDYNIKKYFQHYSQKHHLPILKEMYDGCQFCGSEDKLEIHHKKYTKNINDCLILCQSCHKKIHRKI